MSADSEPRPPREPAFDDQPTRALLLAQALETCIRAERAVPGSADRLIAHQPAWARAELRRLVSLASSLDAVATNAVMSEDFRGAARARLMRRIAAEPFEPRAPAAAMRNGHVAPPNGLLLAEAPHLGSPAVLVRGPRSKWLWRGGAAALLGVALIGAATLTASANALPGEPLYRIKQVGEELGIRLAPDDSARTLALMEQADARLDETARLLRQGRTNEVAQTTQRYDDTLSRATTIVVTILTATPDTPTTAGVQSKLSEQQQQLKAMLVTAPEPARSDIRQALVATERSQALVAGPRPTQIAPSRSPRVVAPDMLPPTASEVLPTEEPTEAPVVASISAPRPPVDVLSRDHEAPPAFESAPQPEMQHAVSPPSAVMRRLQTRPASPPHEEIEPSDSESKPADATPEEVRLPLAPPVVAESQPAGEPESNVVNSHDEHVAAPPVIARPSSNAAQDTNGDSAPPRSTADVVQPAAPVAHTSKDSGGDTHPAVSAMTTQASANSPAQQQAPALAVVERAQPTPTAGLPDDHHGAASQSNSKGQSQAGHGH